MIDAKLFPYSGDLLIANAARGSFGVEYDTWSDEPRGGPRTRSDKQLVDDLAADAHMLPFRHPHVSVRCTAPIPVARQLGKHQVGFQWSEISRRYTSKQLSFHFIVQWRKDPPTRQGVGEDVDVRTNVRLCEIQRRNVDSCLADYSEALSLGASKEQARMLLPQSMEALWVWTGSLLGWADVVHKRSHPDTQQETRDFVTRIDAIMAQECPRGWEALKANPWR